MLTRFFLFVGFVTPFYFVCLEKFGVADYSFWQNYLYIYTEKLFDYEARKENACRKTRYIA